MSIIIQKINPQPNKDSYYETTVELEDNTYGFRFYNSGAFVTPSLWYMDVFDSSNKEMVVAGIRLAVGVSLLEPYKYKGVELIPPGKVFCADFRKMTFDYENQEWIDQPGFDPTYTSFQDSTHGVFYASLEVLNG